MAAVRSRTAAIGVLCGGLLLAGPAGAHPEGQTPYRYVVAPAGVTSAGPPEPGASTQPIGRPGFAGTTDNQMQLTLPAGALPPRAGEQGVRVALDQQDPALLPALPRGFEPEGNVYRVSLTYAASGAEVTRLAVPAPLGLTAPAAPTGVLQLVGERWQPVPYTPVAADEGFSSVVLLQTGTATFLQVYDPASAQSAPAAAGASPPPQPSSALAPTAQAAPRPGPGGGAHVRGGPRPRHAARAGHRPPAAAQGPSCRTMTRPGARGGGS